MNSGLTAALASAPLRSRVVARYANPNSFTSALDVAPGPSRGTLYVDSNGDVVLTNQSNTFYLKPQLRVNGYETGIGIGASSQMWFVANGVGAFSITISGGAPVITYKSTAQLGFGNVDINGASDTVITRQATASLRLGNISSATPDSYTLSVGESSRSGTDSNVAGGNGTINSGVGTGSSTGSSLIFQTPNSTTSGTGAQTQTTRVTINETGITGAVPFMPPVYTVATLPSAATFTNGLIIVSDGTANKRLAISDGTNWRFPDGNIVS